MEGLVAVSDNSTRTDSKLVADAFGKIHRDVLRAISSLDCSDEFRVRNFAQSSYVSSQGKTLKSVSMTRDGFCFLAMGFTGKKAGAWKEAFIEAFNAMDDALKNQSTGAMRALSEAVEALESDSARASMHGKALHAWKKIKQNHIEAIFQANKKAQMLLEF